MHVVVLVWVFLPFHMGKGSGWDRETGHPPSETPHGGGVLKDLVRAHSSNLSIPFFMSTKTPPGVRLTIVFVKR